MRYPWVNVTLFFTLVALLLSGVLGITAGAERSRWLLWLHGAAGYALVLMLLPKARVVLDALRRRPRLRPETVAFLLLAVLVLLILATGLFWTTLRPASVAGFSLMTVHAVLALVALALLAWHTVARRYIVRVRAARDRRAFMRLLGLALGGAALWQLGRSTKSALALPADARRFTGSYETGSLTGSFPVVSWLFDFPAPLRPDDWRLAIGGFVRQALTLTYAELLALPPAEVEATLDCTGGWHTMQVWRGAGLDRLLAMAGVIEGARSFTVIGVSGYSRRFAIHEAGRFILATHIAGQALEHGHGFPARLVAPDYRGYDWVKWVTRIEVNQTSHLLQPPLPLQ